MPVDSSFAHSRSAALKLRSWGPLVGLLLFAAACSSSDSGELEGGSFTLSPPNIDFGEVQLGTTETRSIAVRNSGTQPVQLVVEAGSTFLNDFSFSPAQLSLGPDEDATLTIDFTPSATGARVSDIIVRDTLGGSAPTTVTLRGTGRDDGEVLELSANRLDFGAVVADSSSQQEVVLTNVSAQAIRLRVELGNNVGVCGEPSADVSDFCVDGRGQIDDLNLLDLDASSSATVAIQYNPVMGSTGEGQVSFRACDACRNINLTLTGQAVDSGLACDESIDFGRVFPNECSTAALECRALANVDVTIDRIGARPNRVLPSEFRPAPLMNPVTIPAGGAQSFDIEFCPTDTSETTAILQVAGVDSENRNLAFNVDLVGEGGGARPVVSPARLDFGLTALIAASSRRVVLSNNGFDDLVIRNVVADTSTTGAFSATTPVQRLEPGESVVIEVTFEPTAAQVITSGLRIEFSQLDPIFIPLVGEGINVPPCTYEVETDIDFGSVPANEVREATALIRNIGASDCLIYRLAPEPQTDNDFVFIGTSTRTDVLPSGEVLEVTVRLRLADQAGVVTGGLEVQASNPGRPRRVISLAARRADEGPIVAPNTLDFGIVDTTCTLQTESLRISNPLSTLLSINALRVVNTNGGTAFGVGIVNLPLQIGGGGVQTVDISFAGAGPGIYTGFVEMNANVNGQARLLRAPLRATVTGSAVRGETFRQGYAEVDVLTVFAHSFRSGTFVTEARRSWTDFARDLVATGADYRIGMTTTDLTAEAGRFLPLTLMGPRAITTMTPAPAMAWTQRFRDTTGFRGEFVAGLEASRRALSFPLLTGDNADFRREDTPLSVVMVNPELDTSPGTLSLYLDAIAAQFHPGRQNDWYLSGMAVPPASGTTCNGGFGFGEANARLEDAVNAAGGTFVDWCGDETEAAFQALGAAAAGIRSSWRLAQAAVAASIVVRVNGTSIPATDEGVPQWSYDEDSRTVTFETVALPQAGDDIVIDYAPACSL